MSNHQKGFTLIELMVVIAIIGLLASVVMVALNNARIKSRDAKRIGDIRQVLTAMEMYYNDNQFYPSAAANQVSNITTLKNDLVPKYMSIMPTAPIPADNCNPSGLGGNDYYWAGNGAGTGNFYTITFCLGAAVNSIPAGVHTLTPQGIQ